MLEFTRVSRWFRVADGYTLRYSTGNRNWRVCAPEGKLLGTVGDVIEAERLANQHAENRATADAAIEVRGYSDADIDAAAAEQGIGVGAAMLSLAMGAPYTELSRPSGPFEPVPGVVCPNPDTGPRSCTYPDCDCQAQGRYLTEGHGSARMVTETDDDTGDVTMKPCQCLSPTGEVEDGWIVAAPCGSQVPDKRDFKPGHDAKLKSTLLKAHRNGGTLIVRDGGMRTEASAMELAKERGWVQFMTDAPVRKAAKPKNDDAVFAGDRGELDPETLEPKGASHPARVKVRGAWKDGFVTKIEAGETASSPQTITVTYQNAKRKNIEVTLPSDSDKLQLG